MTYFCFSEKKPRLLQSASVPRARARARVHARDKQPVKLLRNGHLRQAPTNRYRSLRPHISPSYSARAVLVFAWGRACLVDIGSVC